MPARQPITPHPRRSARDARLRYVSDATRGIARRRAGRGFRYLSPRGRPVRDATTLRRIRALAIPPAWTEVWICPSPRGHIQATGRDARGRKQYRYHAAWNAVRRETKFGRMLAFGRALPAIRRQVRADLALPGLPRRKVLATVVRLLECTQIRVGNTEYARSNASFGLTTLRDRHVRVRGHALRFAFAGKSGKRHEVSFTDRRLALAVAHCRSIPGAQLFQYVDEDGRRRAIDSGDVNAYLHELSGNDFSAKDFRTWAGTMLACEVLRDAAEGADDGDSSDGDKSPGSVRDEVLHAIDRVAEQLNNTRAVCRAYYIHPQVLDAHEQGQLVPALNGTRRTRPYDDHRPQRGPASRGVRLSRFESRVLRLLRDRGQTTTRQR